MKKRYRQQLPDRDPQETVEWIDSIASVIDIKGQERARYLLQTLIREARDRDIAIPLLTNSPYVNTIPVSQTPASLKYCSAILGLKLYCGPLGLKPNKPSGIGPVGLVPKPSSMSSMYES